MKPAPKGWPRIASALTCDDPHKEIDFLCKAFGFELILKVEGDKGQIVHSELKFGDGLVMVSGPKDNEHDEKYAFLASPRSIGGKNTQTLMVYVDDVEAHCKRAQEAGANITDPVSMHDYGEEYWADKSYGCRDPEGHNWWFSERVRGA